MELELDLGRLTKLPNVELIKWYEQATAELEAGHVNRHADIDLGTLISIVGMLIERRVREREAFAVSDEVTRVMGGS